VVAGVITQNVDGLHGAAGSREVVELHGALARVRCLDCAAMASRDALQARLLAANPGWLERTRSAAIRPDGDADLPDDLVDGFAVVGLRGVRRDRDADVVFFGGSVPRATLDAAWAMFDRAEVLLVVGSSLTVFSGFRFVRRAAERGVPIGILNRGPTRGDDHAAVRLDARASVALPALAPGAVSPSVTLYCASPTPDGVSMVVLGSSNHARNLLRRCAGIERLGNTID